MKIGPLDKIAPLTPAAESKPGRVGKPTAGSMPAAAEPSAKVELSPTFANMPGDGSFDSAKVERIAQAIRDGKFSVNPEKIAEKLIQNAEELLARRVN
jgi:negative regulator of flagellin synthesis FlgM